MPLAMTNPSTLTRGLSVHPATAQQVGQRWPIMCEHARRPSLMLSLHDVSPRFESDLDRLRNLFAARGVADQLALLVVPNHWNTAPIHGGSPFATRLRRWAEEGNEIFLHGWTHQDNTAHRNLLDRFRARHLTSREGEFLGLDRATAVSLLRDGRWLLEDITGFAVSGFIAPAWLYGKGAMQALVDTDMPLAEDHMRVWEPGTGRTLCRGPVITWASRSTARIRSSTAFATLARPLLSTVRHVRLAVHPGDAQVPVLMDSIEGTLDHFLRRRTVGRYADLLIN